MKLEELEEIIRRESSIGRAPDWLLETLDKAKEKIVGNLVEMKDDPDGDLPEFIYPH